ncbi:hypothetical protein BaRGS_00038090 [Batillaria attramentaria]|uniref:Uncharacterized protein n=1 Tax=Batillaria attramentaria TaxID=370345 RepID=A0ABD0J7Q7_9CAEN
MSVTCAAAQDGNTALPASQSFKRKAVLVTQKAEIDVNRDNATRSPASAEEVRGGSVGSPIAALRAVREGGPDLAVSGHDEGASQVYAESGKINVPLFVDCVPLVMDSTLEHEIVETLQVNLIKSQVNRPLMAATIMGAACFMYLLVSPLLTTGCLSQYRQPYTEDGPWRQVSESLSSHKLEDINCRGKRGEGCWRRERWESRAAVEIAGIYKSCSRAATLNNVQRHPTSLLVNEPMLCVQMYSAYRPLTYTTDYQQHLLPLSHRGHGAMIDDDVNTGIYHPPTSVRAQSTGVGGGPNNREGHAADPSLHRSV